MDAYQEFIKELKIDFDDFIEFGINGTIYPSEESIATFWAELKRRIKDGEAVRVRTYGKYGRKSQILVDFYSFCNINAVVDSNNNYTPTKNLEKLTNKIKNKDLLNYQVSHIFGQTKNVYMFESPWNICYVPKMIDPLTGHESKGKFSVEYKKKWLSGIIKKHKVFIDDYNKIMDDFKINEKLDAFMSDSEVKKKYDSKQLVDFKKNILKDFEKIY